MQEQNNYVKYYPVIIIALILAVWFPALNINFLNDDIQIISWNNPASFWDCFSVFSSTDVMSDYWRPVPAFLHSLVLWLFGMEPAAFHALNLLIYLLNCILIYRLAVIFGCKEKIAFIGAVIFSVLPSHELIVAWISGKNDSLAALFLILATVFYYHAVIKSSAKYFIASAFMFLLAIMSKELAFAGIFIPFIFTLKGYDEKFRKIAVKAFLTALFIILAVLSYRYLVIGGHPFGTRNFANPDIVEILRNFILYIPLSFLSSDTIQTAVHSILIFQAGINILIALTAFLIVILLLKGLYNKLKASGQNDLRRLSGLIWFLIFILPALPLLGRWYVFTASFGLFVFILQGYASLAKTTRKVLLIFITLISILFVYWNYSTMNNWVLTGEMTEQILKSLKGHKLNENETVLLFGVPDKINRVNSMKLGIQESVNYYSESNINVEYPLKCECNNNSTIYQERIAPNKIRLSGNNMRFLPQAGEILCIF